MKHLLRNILLLNLIFLSNSNINSCVSVNYDPEDLLPQKIYSYELEDQVKRVANSFIRPTGFDAFTIPNEFIQEYNFKIRETINTLQKKINASLENCVYLHAVESAVRKSLKDLKHSLTKIILSDKIEPTLNHLAQKLALKKNVDLNKLSAYNHEQYHKTRHFILRSLRETMSDNNRNYVRKSEIKKLVQNELSFFFDQVKKDQDNSWGKIMQSVVNTIFTPQNPNTTPNMQTSNKIYFTDYICSICKNKFVAGDRAAILNCPEKHFFHEGCIKQWFTNQKSCPVCQRTMGENGKDLIIAQIENVGGVQTNYQTPTTDFSKIQSYEFDTKILELANRELSYHGFTPNNLPARVVSDYNDAIKKIKERFQTIMTLENRTYVTQNEAEIVVRDELKPILNKINYIGETCSICLENFKAGDKVGILNCNGAHFFHKDCISAWLNTDARKSCPLCRQENLIVSQIHDVK